MNAEQFKKPQFRKYYSPEDAYNELFNAQDIVPADADRGVYEVQGKNIFFSGSPMLIYDAKNNTYEYQKHPSLGGNFDNGTILKPHQALQFWRFKGDFRKARQFILNSYLNAENKYLRIRTKYYKIVEYTTRYGNLHSDIILWSKENITDDYGKGELKRVKQFDDFTVVPDNINYRESYGSYYNLYKPFPHKPTEQTVNATDIPTVYALMAHIFGEQIELGFQYLKIMYEEPKQILPVLCLVSEKRQTGKSTFLEFLDMVFGPNLQLIDSETLTSNFNSSYAHKNIICIDETVIEKASAVEKIKMLATAKMLPVNMKHVAEYSVPFYGKIVMATNKEKDFMRIDNEEIRFWIRRPEPVKHVDPNYEKKLLAEIPKFLRYLLQMDEVKKTGRMVFSSEQIRNKYLDAVKEESKSTLRKDIELRVCARFDADSSIDEFYATPIDIKEKWFNSSRFEASYVRKVLKDEMKMTPTNQPSYYIPFADQNEQGKTGRYYTFKRIDYVDSSQTVLPWEEAESGANNPIDSDETAPF